MKIALLGDIAFFGKFSLKNNVSLFDYFKEVSNKLKEYDLVIGNLETPFADEETKSFGYKSAYIKSEPINIELLKFLNINIVNLSNNHIYDFGKKSYDLTKEILDQNNIKYFGIEGKDLKIQFNENNIILDGFCCYSTNPLGINDHNNDGINDLDVETVSTKLKNNLKDNLFTIFSFHCGQEHVNYPNYDHVELARKLASIGPYIFYGHHPHVAQGIEKVNDSLIAYSLGNFCFDDVYTEKSKNPIIKQTENNKESFILELTVEKNKLLEHKIVPVYLDNDKMTLNRFEIVDKIDNYSKKLLTDSVAYKIYRKQLVDNYINSRKKLRDFNWFIKRLNYKSFFLILATRKNAKKYCQNIKNKL